MKFLAALYFVAICIFSRVASESFQCYECDGDDCNSKDTMKLMVCYNPDEPETPPVTESSSTTTTTASTTTTDEGITTPTETESTTTTNGSSTTTAQAQPSTTTAAEATTTESDPTVANSPITTTVTGAPTTEPPATTTINSAPTIPAESTATTVASPATTAAVASSTSEESTTTSTEDTTANNEATSSPLEKKGSSTGDTISAAAILIRNYRSISRQRRDNDYGHACFTIKYKGSTDSDVKIQKGCIKIDVMKTGCESVKDKLAEKKIEECAVCMNSKCNSSTTIKLSLLLGIILAVARFLM